MAVTIDLDNAGDIHPPNKIDVGERLARWPLAKVYGREVACSGPLYRGISVRGNTLIVDFHHAEGGLMTGSIDGVGKLTPQPDAALNGFEVSGKDGKWHVAKAKVEGSSVVISSPGVQQPVAVRYACHPQAPAGSPWNLYNREGLPASPFCSDWNRMPYDPARNPPPGWIKCHRNHCHRIGGGVASYKQVMAEIGATKIEGVPKMGPMPEPAKLVFTPNTGIPECDEALKLQFECSQLKGELGEVAALDDEEEDWDDVAEDERASAGTFRHDRDPF